jgi:lipoprotein-anchoring transpeptidase ErfK/SrfK
MSSRVATVPTVAVAIVGLLLSVFLGAPPAAAAAPYPDAPTITAVTPTASGTLVVAFSAPASDGGSPITAYEVSLDGGSAWYTCAPMDNACPLGNLKNGQPYTILLRARNAQGAGDSSTPASATPLIPAGADPDKPARLPRPRVAVTASFNAAANGLGVDGSSVRLGVGTLPRIKFSRSIPDKAVVERHLTVTATDDATGRTTVVPGSWGWLDDSRVAFRPRNFWPGHSLITITSSLDRAVLGKSGAVSLVGAKSLGTSYTFRTARSFIGRVDGAKRQMRVYVDGKKVRTISVSLGTTDWETRNGVKVVTTAKEPAKTYTSQSLGITDPTQQYELDAKWNTRLTPTGEFIHTATWAYGRIGRWNGSHGCTNMFEKDAKFIFDETIPGDVITYENTNGTTVEPWNGAGGLWNIPWSSWLKKSALSSITGLADTSGDDDSGSIENAKPAGV